MISHNDEKTAVSDNGFEQADHKHVFDFVLILVLVIAFMSANYFLFYHSVDLISTQEVQQQVKSTEVKPQKPATLTDKRSGAKSLAGILNVIYRAKSISQLETDYSTVLAQIFDDPNTTQNESVVVCLSARCLSSKVNDPSVRYQANYNLDSAKAYLSLITPEILRYDSDRAAKFFPDTLGYVSDIELEGQPVGGANFGSNYSQVILVEDGQPESPSNNEYLTSTLNHELFHSYKRGSIVSATAFDYGWYQIEERDYHKPSTTVYADGWRIANGYVSSYAQVDAEEDQAETYAYFMEKIADGKGDVAQVKDPKVKRKIEYIIQQVYSQP